MEASLRCGDIQFTMSASFSITASGFPCHTSLGQNLVTVQKPIRANSSFRFGQFPYLHASHVQTLVKTMTSITRISNPGFINLFKDCIFCISRQAIVRFNGSGVQIDVSVSKLERIIRDLCDGDGDGEDCSICLSAMKKEDTVVRTPCLHEFHYHCVKTWLNQRQTCPLCRYDGLV